MSTTSKTFTARRRLSKMVPIDPENPDRGRHSVTTGYETGQVEITVDLQAIADQLAVRAMGSNRGISKFMAGAVVARVISRRKEA